MRRVIWLLTPTAFWQSGGTISPSYWIFMGLVRLGRQIRTTEPLVPKPSAFEFEMAFEKLKRHKSPGTDHLPVGCIKQWVEQIGLRSTNLFRSGIRKNCLRIGRSRSLYLFIRKVIKQIVVITGHITFVNYAQNCIQHPAVKLNSICTWNYWGSSVWITTQQVKYWTHICIRQILEKNANTLKQCISYL